jgi:hypothetical protein
VGAKSTAVERNIQTSGRLGCNRLASDYARSYPCAE